MTSEEYIPTVEAIRKPQLFVRLAGGLYMSPDVARKLALRLNDAANDAERIEDGIYRVTLSHTPHDTLFLRVIKGAACYSDGGIVYQEYTLHERVGNIPEGGMP